MKTYLKIVGLFFCMMSVSSVFAQQQEANLKLTDNINKTTKHEVATETISASNVVGEESKVHYEAGKSVKLLPGFSAKSGSNFKASIGRVASSAKIAGAEPSETLKMYDAYPNPFESKVDIQYYLPKASKVTLSITNIIGMNVATLIDNEDMTEGDHSVTFTKGNTLVEGTYLYTLKTETGAVSKKLMKK
jgi:uncharacterized protein YfcZ (UPF0381/DUF406 family)